MSRNRIAHRADFSVRCACGLVYNTDDSHVGRQIKCKCGRTVNIVRPKEEYAEAYLGAAAAEQAKREAAAKATAKRAAKAKRRAMLRGGLRSIPLALWRVVGDATLEMLSAAVSSRRWRRFTARAVWAWLGVCLVSWALLSWASESFLPAMMLAYGPRFVMLLPLLVLIPAAVVFARVMIWPLLFSLWIVLHPVMGGRISTAAILHPFAVQPTAGTLRVVTYNADGGQLVVGRLSELLDATHPDVVAVQECGPALRDSMATLPSWYHASYLQLCFMSRWPITSTDSMPRADFARIGELGVGGSAAVVRYTLATPRGTLRIVNVHLETARKGLEGMLHLGPDVETYSELDTSAASEPTMNSAARLKLNTLIRDRESERASVWAEHGDRTMPTLIVGDFNLPVESEIFQRHWRGFTDSFEAVGSGFGWTKQEGTLLRVRIDHVLSNQFGPRPSGTWLGRDYGSDHRPLIVDLTWPTR